MQRSIDAGTKPGFAANYAPGAESYHEAHFAFKQVADRCQRSSVTCPVARRRRPAGPLNSTMYA